MDIEHTKCVMVIDETLPVGIIANTAGILGITLGKQVPEIVGRDVTDSDEKLHKGIVEISVPILKANADSLKVLRETLYKAEYNDIRIVDFSDIAQSCTNYDKFEEKMNATPKEKIQYLGLALCGNKKKINKLTGNMPLLR